MRPYSSTGMRNLIMRPYSNTSYAPSATDPPDPPDPEMSQLIDTDYISPLFTDVRAGSAWAFNADGELVEYGANAVIPRYDPNTGEWRGVMISEQRTNFHSNPRFEGSGSLPSGVGTGNARGLSTTKIGTGTIDGMNYVDIRVHGTANNTASYQLNMSSTVSIGEAEIGDVVTFSMCSQLVAGNFNNLNSVQIQVYEPQSGHWPNTYTNIETQATADKLAKSRASVSHTKELDGTGHVIRFIAMVISGQAVDFTMRFAVPQFEFAPNASDPILPPVGTQATSTRNAARPRITQDFEPLWNLEETTVLSTINFPVPSIPDWVRVWVASQVGGELTQAFQMTKGVNALSAFRYSANNNASVIIVNPIVVDTVYRCASAFKAGEQATAFNGGNLQTSTSTIMPEITPTALYLGMRGDGLNAVPYVEITKLHIYPNRLPNTELTELTE